MAKRKPKSEPQQHQLPQQFWLVAADLSLKRPGFCKMLIQKQNEQVSILSFDVANVNNKTKTKPHGQLLDETLASMAFFFPDEGKEQYPVYYVREKAALSSFSLAMIGQAKMAGMADWLVWHQNQKQWDEIAPNAVKRLVAGNGNAEKDEVAKALETYIGAHEYRFDDESDAAAVGVAWLIQNKVMKTLVQPTEKSDAESEENKE